MLNVLKTKKIKAAIAEDPANVQQIIDNEKEMGICITNKDGYFVTVNDRYTDIYKYRRDELIGKHFSMMLPADDAEKLSKRHDSFIKDKHEIIRNWRVKDRTGNILNIQADAGYSDTIFDGTPHKVTFVYYKGSAE
ncbi:MAG: PAS domain-containing protein [Salinivirgaceae bacterium]